MSNTDRVKIMRDALAKRDKEQGGTMTFEEFYGKEQCDIIRERLEALFKNKLGGFIIFCNLETKKLSDAYMAICPHHVREAVESTVTGATEMGILPSCSCEKD